MVEIRAFKLPMILVAGQLLVSSHLCMYAQTGDASSRTVVFVCEHGSVAVARGTKPDEKIDPKVSRELAADGLDVGNWKPVKLSGKDVSSANRVISLAPELPVPTVLRARIIPEWKNIPAVSDD